MRTKDVFRAPRKRAPKAERESTIQKKIVTWLVEHDCLVAITDAGALAKMGIPYRCGIPRGWPDLTCCDPQGRFIGIETKTEKGKQSQDQTFYDERIMSQGGLYYLVRSVEDLQDQWNLQEIIDNSSC